MLVLLEQVNTCFRARTHGDDALVERLDPVREGDTRNYAARAGCSCVDIDHCAAGRAGEGFDFAAQRGDGGADEVVVCHVQLAISEDVDGVGGVQEGVFEVRD
jgi:hypothetical protein